MKEVKWICPACGSDRIAPVGCHTLPRRASRDSILEHGCYELMQDTAYCQACGCSFLTYADQLDIFVHDRTVIADALPCTCWLVDESSGQKQLLAQKKMELSPLFVFPPETEYKALVGIPGAKHTLFVSVCALLDDTLILRERIVYTTYTTLRILTLHCGETYTFQTPAADGKTIQFVLEVQPKVNGGSRM